MNYNLVYDYKPYLGGAGPTQSETLTLNAKLFNALWAEGLHPVFVVENDDGVDFDYVVVGSRRVTYDRWGYVNNDGNPDVELDQVDLNAAVAYFMES